MKNNKNNTRQTVAVATSNKYWENETPVVTETEFGGISYFKNAGKIQLYSMYTKDGELNRGKGCTWDNNEMEADDAVRLVYALMQGLIDVGVSNDAYADAYALMQDAVASLDGDGADDEVDEDEIDETLDEEFEDEDVDYNELKIGDLKEICTNRGLELPKKVTKSALVALLEADDENSDEADDEGDDEAEVADAEIVFMGKNLKYEGGELSKVKKSVKKDYIEWGEDAIEWANYIAELASELDAMPTKTPKQKKAQDARYAEVKAEVDEWVDAWEELADTVKPIVKELVLGKMEVETAIIKFLAIVDKIKF